MTSLAYTFSLTENRFSDKIFSMDTLKRLIKLKRLFLLLLTPVAAVLLYVAKRNPWFTEYVFARGFFKIYSQIFSMLSGAFAFSLAEYGIIFAVFAVPAIIVFEIVHIVKTKGKRLYIIFRDLLTVACIASLAYFLLVVGCSVNYYRYSFADIAGLTVRDSSVEELKALCFELGERASAARAKITTEDEEGCMVLPGGMNELALKCRDAYNKLAGTYPCVGGFYARPKCIIHSTFMSRTEFTGVYVPFTMESNVNIDVPHYSIASTMCHELAHLRGFIREDEANYLAYLACTASDDPVLQYSGLAEALIYAGNALAGKDMDAYSELYASVDQGIIRDFVANSRYWDQFHNTVISNTADAINDSYLKANDQEDGVQSYGRVVDLLLAEYRKNHGID